MKEIIVDPRTGKWYTVGDNGAEFVNVPSGAIVFNHKQTESLLNYGYVSGRASALVSGTALVSGGYKPYTPPTSLSSANKSNNPSGNSGSNPGSTKGNNKEESWFEKQYKEHKHLLEMDKEEVAEYLKWLDTAYQKAYKEGIIELDDFYKYQEEVYKGLQDLFKDYLNDVEHEISMREHFDGENGTIVKLYKELMSEIEKEIKAARAAGLDDNDEYIQGLQDKWFSYSDAIKNLEDDIVKGAKSALEKLIDFRINMIKDDVKNEKESIDKKLNYLKEFYDKQKKMLQDVADEEKYLDEQSEKRKSVVDIQAQLTSLEYDSSAWAEKRKAELRQELAEAQKELDSFEKDHALDVAIDALDNAYDSQETQLKKEMDALEDTINDPNALYNKALTDIKNNSKNQLYYTMLMYNRQYGDGKDDTVKEMWEEAFGALSDYKDLYGSAYEGVTLKNETGYRPNTGWDTSVISGTNKANQPSSSSGATSSQNGNKTGTSGTVSGLSGSFSYGSRGDGVRAIQTALNALGFNCGEVDGIFGVKTKSAVIAFQAAAKYGGAITADGIVGPNTKSKFKTAGYASGTRSATAGFHTIDELGTETIFESSDGARYKMFSGGEKVLNAKASNFLYDFANSGGEILSKIVNAALSGNIFDKIMPVINNNNVNMGDIIINGSANESTVSEIRRAQRDNLKDMLKSFNKLSRA